MNLNRSQDGYLSTGKPSQYRVRGDESNWYVEATDNNNVWVDAEPGFRYASQAEAIAYAENLASENDGTVID